MRWLADLILVIHLLWVLIVTLPLLLIPIGARRNWSWIRNFFFRVIHLIMIGIVFFETLLGLICPLTLWEELLRQHSRKSSYEGKSFVEYWVGRLLFHDLPPWVFISTYLLIGLIAVILFRKIPPRNCFGTHALRRDQGP